MQRSFIPGTAIRELQGIPEPDHRSGMAVTIPVRRKDNHLSDAWENIRRKLRIVVKTGEARVP